MVLNLLKKEVELCKLQADIREQVGRRAWQRARCSCSPCFRAYAHVEPAVTATLMLAGGGQDRQGAAAHAAHGAAQVHQEGAGPGARRQDRAAGQVRAAGRRLEGGWRVVGGWWGGWLGRCGNKLAFSWSPDGPKGCTSLGKAGSALHATAPNVLPCRARAAAAQVPGALGREEGAGAAGRGADRAGGKLCRGAAHAALRLQQAPCKRASCPFAGPDPPAPFHATDSHTISCMPTHTISCLTHTSTGRAGQAGRPGAVVARVQHHAHLPGLAHLAALGRHHAGAVRPGARQEGRL
jgi:hypothetical protein